MIFVKTGEEIELLRESNRLVGMTLGEMAKHIRPGISTLELDRIAEEFIRDHGAEPGFLGYGGVIPQYANTFPVRIRVFPLKNVFYKRGILFPSIVAL